MIKKSGWKMDIKFIADIGSNHNQDIQRCYTLIDAAKAAGCWGVKFQIFNPEKLYRDAGIEGIRNLNNQAFCIEWIDKVLKYCRNINIKCGMTPFNVECVDKIGGFDFIKISSFDIGRLDLITECIKLNKPMIFSLGLAYKVEVHNLLRLLKDSKYKEVALLHCVSEYPARGPLSFHKIHWINSLNFENIIRVIPGYSDHTGGSTYVSGFPAIIKATYMGDTIIEFHIDLDDMRGSETKHGHCYRGTEIKNIIDTVNVKPDYSKRASSIDGLRN